MADELNIHDLDDWLLVPSGLIHNLKGAQLLRYAGGIAPFLAKRFPHHNWKLEAHKLSKKTQSQLYKTLTDLFPLLEITMDYKHSDMTFTSSKKMELDLFIPSLSIAFEYMGEHHFQAHFLYGDPEQVQMRDVAKRKMCEEGGITLVEIPPTWGKHFSKDFLLDIIAKKCPVLLAYLSPQRSQRQVIYEIRFPARITKQVSLQTCNKEFERLLCSKFCPKDYLLIDSTMLGKKKDLHLWKYDNKKKFEIHAYFRFKHVELPGYQNSSPTLARPTTNFGISQH